jgi:DNA polymerase/3'-5' exonuclease PolX
MLYHEKIIKKIVATISHNKFEATIVGSFRREKNDSGDIDVLLSYPHHENLSKKEAEIIFKEIVNEMIKKDYISDVLALGIKKCMAVCTHKDKFRRLDILLTTPDEYPFAILYFTGSDKFNITMRRKALQMGYSLNEYRLIPLDEKIPIPDDLKTEKDIFKFLDIDYLDPKDR